MWSGTPCFSVFFTTLCTNKRSYVPLMYHGYVLCCLDKDEVQIGYVPALQSATVVFPRDATYVPPYVPPYVPLRPERERRLIVRMQNITQIEASSEQHTVGTSCVLWYITPTHKPGTQSRYIAPGT